MPRIVYFAFPGGVQGGVKMILRHVETLRELGFDAVCYLGAGNRPPDWFEHRAPIEVGAPVRPDDILVFPDDAHEALKVAATAPSRTIVFSQNPYYFAAVGFEALERFPPERLPVFIAVGQQLAAFVRRAFPQARVEVVPCFADERVFRPGCEKRDVVAYAPRKRPLEADAIRGMFRRLHPEHAGLGWTRVQDATERQVADAFGGARLFLSLSRLESVGMTPLEAMAAGCVCAGFVGVGGREYATDDNGFWAPDEDCEAAADALARAADLVRTGGQGLAHVIEAGRETARRWSYAAFRARLEEVWSRLAPEARTL
ncbi:glycosyltransferase [Phenylobacterium sp.]|jgi:hypothetical protein|uniref:glycosyltransferase n=1 Tax=Phenylobacterium sp. TaxID=1871053 RepID=UPI002F921D52